MLGKPASDTQITHFGRLWLYVFGTLVLLFLLGPIFIVIPMSFSDSSYLRFPPETWSLRWYREFFGSDEWLAATWISFRAAFLTMLVSTPLGIAAAYGLRFSGSRWATLMRMALIMPLIIPIIILAVGAFYLYVKLGLVNTTLGLVLAHSVLAMPFVLVTSAYGRRVSRETLREERENTAAALFGVEGDAPERMTAVELHERLQPDDPTVILIDVRSRSSYESDGVRIPGDVRVRPDETLRWAAAAAPDRLVVAYCT